MMMTKHHNSHGQSATAIGLAAGLGGGALLLAIGLGWGINKASEAALAQNNNSGINSAIGSENFLRVQRYSAPQPCGCDTCGN